MKTVKKLQGWGIRFLLGGGIVIAGLFAVLFAASFSQPADAVTTVPTRMNFQGRLANSAGNIMPNGNYNMKFRIYDAASAGNLQWNEDRLVSASQSVTVTNGQFSVQLGSVNPLPASIFNGTTLYFEVELPTPATATSSSPTWTEGVMTPRNQLATSAYAFNADTLDGIDSASFAQIGASNTFSGVNSFTGATNVNVSNAAAFQVKNGSTNLFNVDTANSIVTIGTTDATAAVLALDTKNTSGDPTGASAVNGAMYYNSNAGKFRCYQNGAWVDCITSAGGSTTLQNAYDNSASPATITTTAAKGVAINAGAVPTADLFSVSNAGYGVTAAGINAVSVNYTGGAAAVEGSGIRIDHTPGTTSGGTWSGLRIVSNATGPASGVTSYGIKIEGPTSQGAGNEVGLRVASGFDIGLDVASGGLQLSGMGDPASPAMGDLRVYAKTNGGRTMLKIKGGSGIDTALQPFFATNRVQMLQPFINTTTFGTGTYYGMSAPNFTNYTTGTTASTTATISRTISQTNLYSSVRKSGFNTSTAANSVAGLRGSNTAPVVRGNAGQGGFYYVGRFGIATYQSGLRSFAGLMANSSLPSSVEPSSQANIAGVGCDSTDSNLSFMSNDASGSATKVSLGASFPCNTSSTDVYELRLFMAPGGSTLYYSVARLNTTDFVEGTAVTASADIPASGTFLYPHFYINNTTAAMASFDFMSLYIETDN